MLVKAMMRASSESDFIEHDCEREIDAGVQLLLSQAQHAISRHNKGTEILTFDRFSRDAR
jgi:hypothetical protein